MNKKISVIVPAYNVEKYINKCINSILGQTYKNIEVIVVDDGSTDQTSKICDEVAQSDKKVRVIHQKNQGLSQARNNGIKASTGSYISLIDGDDIVEPDFLKNMASVMRDDIDIVVSGYKTINANSNIRSINRKDNAVLSGKSATIELLTKQEDFFVIAWNKLYKKDIFIKNNIWYPAGRIHEDNLTTYKLLSKAHKVAIIDAVDYSYVKRAGSITNKSKKDLQINEKINAAKEAILFFEDKDLCEAAKYSLFLAQIIKLNIAINSRDYELCNKTITEILGEDYTKNKFCTTKGKFYISILKGFSGKLYVMLREIVDKVSQ